VIAAPGVTDERPAMDYRWIISHVGSNYGWAILDADGERVSSGIAPSRADAVLAAERARLRIREAKRPLKPDQPEGD
jgi:hypothetical protein